MERGISEDRRGKGGRNNEMNRTRGERMKKRARIGKGKKEGRYRGRENNLK